MGEALNETAGITPYPSGDDDDGNDDVCCRFPPLPPAPSSPPPPTPDFCPPPFFACLAQYFDQRLGGGLVIKGTHRIMLDTPTNAAAGFRPAMDSVYVVTVTTCLNVFLLRLRWVALS